MKNISSILIGIFLLAFVSCHQPHHVSVNYQEEVKQKIAELDKLYFEAWQNKNLDSTLTFLDEGFLNMFSFSLSQTKEQCREAWEIVFDTYLIKDVEFKSIECFVDNNYAFETGHFKQTWINNDKKDTIFFNMRGITVFKKQEDSSWKIFRLMGQQ